MDPTSAGFLASVVANGFTSLVAHTLGPDRVRSDEAGLVAAIIADRSSRSLLERAASEAAKQIAELAVPTHEQLELALTAPEIEGAVRRVLAAAVSESKCNADELRQQFTLAVCSQLGSDSDGTK